MPGFMGGLKGAHSLQPAVVQTFWIKNSHPVELFCKILVDETVLQWMPCLPQKRIGKSSSFPWIPWNRTENKAEAVLSDMAP